MLCLGLLAAGYVDPLVSKPPRGLAHIPPTCSAPYLHSGASCPHSESLTTQVTRGTCPAPIATTKGMRYPCYTCFQRAGTGWGSRGCSSNNLCNGPVSQRPHSLESHSSRLPLPSRGLEAIVGSHHAHIRTSCSAAGSAFPPHYWGLGTPLMMLPEVKHRGTRLCFFLAAGCWLYGHMARGRQNFV